MEMEGDAFSFDYADSDEYSAPSIEAQRPAKFAGDEAVGVVLMSFKSKDYEADRVKFFPIEPKRFEEDESDRIRFFLKGGTAMLGFVCTGFFYASGRTTPPPTQALILKLLSMISLAVLLSGMAILWILFLRRGTR